MKNLLYRNEMYKEIFKNKSEVKYIIAGYVELLDIFCKNNFLSHYKFYLDLYYN